MYRTGSPLNSTIALDAFTRSVLVFTSILLDFKYQSSESASQVVTLPDCKRFLFSPSKKIALASPRKSYDLFVITVPFLMTDFSSLSPRLKLNEASSMDPVSSLNLRVSFEPLRDMLSKSILVLPVVMSFSETSSYSITSALIVLLPFFRMALPLAFIFLSSRVSRLSPSISIEP